MKLKLLVLLFAALLFFILPSCKSSIGGQVESTTFAPSGPIDTVLHTYRGILSCPNLVWNNNGSTERGAFIEDPSWAVIVLNINNKDFEPMPIYTNQPANYFVYKSYRCDCYFNGEEATVYVDSSSLTPLRLRTAKERDEKLFKNTAKYE